MTMNKDVWVLLEEEDAKVKGSSLALMEEGEKLSTQSGGELHGIMFAKRIQEIDQMVGTYGVNRLYLFNQEALEHYVPNVYEKLLTEILLRNKPFLFLAAATSLGSDLMPRIAAKLKFPLVTNCVEIKIHEDVEFIKPVQNGRLHATVICKATGTKMATIDPNVLTVSEEKNRTRIAKIIEMSPEVGEFGPILVKGYLKADHRTIDLTEADIIVAVGRGIGSNENLKIIEQFADRIQAAMGGTRPIVDVGILPFERQIGQTGKMVSPRLIVMCGISGAMEFTRGVENARTKIAINIDRHAPIFRYTDLGIVADANLLVRKMTEYLDKKYGKDKKF